MGTSAPTFSSPKSTKANNLLLSKWLTLRRLSTSATSTIGMAKARSTFSSSEMSCMLLANTTKKVCVGLGQTDEEGKKFAKFDDVVQKVQAAADTPNSSGAYA